jgi:hypothetical protein
LGLGYSIDGDGSYEFLRWEYGYVSIVSFALIGSRGSRKDVWARVGFPRYVMDDEVVFLQVCVPPGCTSVEVLWGFPILEVCMVSEDDKREFCPSQVVPPVG